MPCRDYRDDYPSERIVYQTDPATQKQITDLQDRVDKLAEMLCGAMRSLPPALRAEVATGVNGLASWWIQHEEFDKQEGRH